MPRLRKPISAIDVLVFITNAVQTHESDKKDGYSYLSDTIVQKSTSLIPKLRSGMGELASEKSEAQKEVREKNVQIDLLNTYLRDLWVVLRRRVYREKLPADVFAFYQLPKDGSIPNTYSNGQIIELADLVVKGDAKAVEKGFAAMVNPSAEELQVQVELARQELADVARTDQKLDQAQEAVSDLMPEATAIVDRIIAELQFSLYGKDEASKRRIMRNYGVRYEVTKNEVSEHESDFS